MGHSVHDIRFYIESSPNTRAPVTSCFDIILFSGRPANTFIYLLWRSHKNWPKSTYILGNVPSSLINLLFDAIRLTDQTTIALFEFVPTPQTMHAMNYCKDPLFALSAAQKEYGYRLARSLGLYKDSRWICIHNRDSAYLNKRISLDSSIHNYRDFGPECFSLLIEYANRLGYRIVRIGAEASHPIPRYPTPVIDLPFNQHRTDFLEMFLLSEASAYVGSASGIANAALIFGVPSGLINLSISEFITYSKYSHGWPCSAGILFSLLQHDGVERVLSLAKMEQDRLFDIYETKEFLKRNVRFRYNTAEEVLAFGKEILSNRTRLSDLATIPSARANADSLWSKASKIINGESLVNCSIPIGIDFYEKYKHHLLKPLDNL